MLLRPPRSTRTEQLIPCTTLFRSQSASTGSPAAPGLVQYPCQPDSGFILIASVTDSPGLGVRDSKASDASIWRSWADAGARAMTPTPKASVTTSVSRRRKTIMDYASLPAACRSEEHTSELQSLMRSSYAVLCLKNKHT